METTRTRQHSWMALGVLVGAVGVGMAAGLWSTIQESVWASATGAVVSVLVAVGAGIVIELATDSANRLGRGLAIGATLGFLGVYLFLSLAASALGFMVA